MPLYICYFEEVLRCERLPIVDIEDLVQGMAAAWGPAKAEFHNRTIQFDLTFPAILTRKQRQQIRRETVAALNDRFPSREFRAGLIVRQPALPFR